MPIISNRGRNLSNTRNSVSSGYPNTRRELKIRRAEIRGVWIADETLSRVFDISPQSIKE